MFYLLENGKIIDSEKCIVKIVQNEWLCNKYNYCLGKIKKQSENVYDLIEFGDLLFLPFYCGDMLISRFDTFESYENNLFYCWIHTVREKEIYAIYKPDSEGNFIKVWEKKEDE